MVWRRTSRSDTAVRKFGDQLTMRVPLYSSPASCSRTKASTTASDIAGSSVNFSRVQSADAPRRRICQAVHAHAHASQERQYIAPRVLSVAPDLVHDVTTFLLFPLPHALNELLTPEFLAIHTVSHGG